MSAPTDGTDDYTVQQENELEALASIFGDDFQDLRNNDTWKVAGDASATFSGRIGAKSWHVPLLTNYTKLMRSSPPLNAEAALIWFSD